MGSRRAGAVAREPGITRLFGGVAVVLFVIAVLAWPVALVLDSHVARVVAAAAIGAWPVMLLAFLGSDGYEVERASGDRVRAVSAVVGAAALTVAMALGLVQAVAGDGRFAVARAVAGGVLAACFLASLLRRRWPVLPSLTTPAGPAPRGRHGAPPRHAGTDTDRPAARREADTA